jgi:hypothetical protein
MSSAEQNPLASAPIPQAFLCPITFSVMRSPVVADDGHTYEKTAITQWLAHNNSSPITREKISNRFVPNHNLIQQINEFFSTHKETLEQIFIAYPWPRDSFSVEHSISYFDTSWMGIIECTSISQKGPFMEFVIMKYGREPSKIVISVRYKQEDALADNFLRSLKTASFPKIGFAVTETIEQTKKIYSLIYPNNDFSNKKIDTETMSLVNTTLLQA